MPEPITIWTLDWVPIPDGPAGFVRDLRLRWACEEAGLHYVMRTISSEDSETTHLGSQPFGQVPFLKDGGIEIFESGACLLYLARKSEKLMPRDVKEKWKHYSGQLPRSTRSRWFQFRGGSWKCSGHRRLV